MLAELSALPDGRERQDLLEGICSHVAAELVRQGLSGMHSDYLLDHCPEMMERIRDPLLRRSHIMED